MKKSKVISIAAIALLIVSMFSVLQMSTSQAVTAPEIYAPNFLFKGSVPYDIPEWYTAEFDNGTEFHIPYTFERWNESDPDTFVFPKCCKVNFETDAYTYFESYSKLECQASSRLSFRGSSDIMIQNCTVIDFPGTETHGGHVGVEFKTDCYIEFAESDFSDPAHVGVIGGRDIILKACSDLRVPNGTQTTPTLGQFQFHNGTLKFLTDARLWLISGRLRIDTGSWKTTHGPHSVAAGKTVTLDDAIINILDEPEEFHVDADAWLEFKNASQFFINHGSRVYTLETQTWRLKDKQGTRIHFLKDSKIYLGDAYTEIHFPVDGGFLWLEKYGPTIVRAGSELHFNGRQTEEGVPISDKITVWFDNEPATPARFHLKTGVWCSESSKMEVEKWIAEDLPEEERDYLTTMMFYEGGEVEFQPCTYLEFQPSETFKAPSSSKFNFPYNKTVDFPAGSKVEFQEGADIMVQNCTLVNFQPSSKIKLPSIRNKPETAYDIEFMESDLVEFQNSTFVTFPESADVTFLESSLVDFPQWTTLNFKEGATFEPRHWMEVEFKESSLVTFMECGSVEFSDYDDSGYITFMAGGEFLVGGNEEGYYDDCLNLYIVDGYAWAFDTEADELDLQYLGRGDHCLYPAYLVHFIEDTTLRFDDIPTPELHFQVDTQVHFGDNVDVHMIPGIVVRFDNMGEMEFEWAPDEVQPIYTSDDYMKVHFLADSGVHFKDCETKIHSQGCVVHFDEDVLIPEIDTDWWTAGVHFVEESEVHFWDEWTRIHFIAPDSGVHFKKPTQVTFTEYGESKWLFEESDQVKFQECTYVKFPEGPITFKESAKVEVVEEVIKDHVLDHVDNDYDGVISVSDYILLSSDGLWHHVSDIIFDGGTTGEVDDNDVFELDDGPWYKITGHDDIDGDSDIDICEPVELTVKRVGIWFYADQYLDVQNCSTVQLPHSKDIDFYYCSNITFLNTTTFEIKTGGVELWDGGSKTKHYAPAKITVPADTSVHFDGEFWTKIHIKHDDTWVHFNERTEDLLFGNLDEFYDATDTRICFEDNAKLHFKPGASFHFPYRTKVCLQEPIKFHFMRRSGVHFEQDSEVTFQRESGVHMIGTYTLDPCDYIDMVRLEPQGPNPEDCSECFDWFHVEEVDTTTTPITITLVSETDGTERILEFLEPPYELACLQRPFRLGNPIGTLWHEIYPTFSQIWNLTSWIDNGVLQPYVNIHFIGSEPREYGERDEVEYPASSLVKFKPSANVTFTNCTKAHIPASTDVDIYPNATIDFRSCSEVRFPGCSAWYNFSRFSRIHFLIDTIVEIISGSAVFDPILADWADGEGLPYGEYGPGNYSVAASTIMIFNASWTVIKFSQDTKIHFVKDSTIHFPNITRNVHFQVTSKVHFVNSSTLHFNSHSIIHFQHNSTVIFNSTSWVYEPEPIELHVKRYTPLFEEDTTLRLKGSIHFIRPSKVRFLEETDIYIEQPSTIKFQPCAWIHFPEDTHVTPYISTGAGGYVWLNLTIYTGSGCPPSGMYPGPPTVTLNRTEFGELGGEPPFPPYGYSYGGYHPDNGHTWHIYFRNNTNIDTLEGYLPVEITATGCGPTALTSTEEIWMKLDFTAPTVDIKVYEHGTTIELPFDGEDYIACSDTEMIDIHIIATDNFIQYEHSYLYINDIEVLAGPTRPTYEGEHVPCWRSCIPFSYNISAYDIVYIKDIVTDGAWPTHHSKQGDVWVYRDILTPPFTVEMEEILGGIVLYDFEACTHAEAWDVIIDGWDIYVTNETLYSDTLVGWYYPASEIYCSAYNGKLIVDLTAYTGTTLSIDVTAKYWGGKESAPVHFETTVEEGQFYLLELYEGWNLISLPLIPPSGKVSTSDLFGVLEVGEGVYEYDASTKSWKWYTVGDDTIVWVYDGRGYWYYTLAYEILIVEGFETPPPGMGVPPTYHVYEDWNLMGFKSTTAMPASEYMASLKTVMGEWKVHQVLGYNAETQTFELIFVRDTPTDELMQPGQGFWYFVLEEGDIVPP